ncbi:Zinc finger RING/FYVE/PHD-type [Perkinsela sp. CCAP 1560/4]|nr:Zinc finger RING/FYVE/PHD-type [Perkinsela sp. CCAP 1560/4]|eukprot:KNH06749.1 Zinc finger RING/FYVE/PHD-type [Perkinsela sp. CCAP 1560/4]
MTDTVYQELFHDACKLLQWRIEEWQNEAELEKKKTCDLIHRELEFYFSELDRVLASEETQKPSNKFISELKRLRQDSTVDKNDVCLRFSRFLQEQSCRMVDKGLNTGKKILHTTMKTQFSSKTSNDINSDAKTDNKLNLSSKHKPSATTQELLLSRKAKDKTNPSITPGRRCTICQGVIKEKGRVKTLPCFHEVHPECMESLGAAGQESKPKECCSTSLKLMSMNE